MKKTYGELFESVVLAASFKNTFTDGTDQTKFIKKMFSETEKWLIKKYETNVRKQIDSFNPTPGVADYNLDYYNAPSILTQPFSLIDRLYYKIAGSNTEYPLRMIGPGAMQEARSYLTVSSLRLYYCCVEGQTLRLYPTPSSTNVTIYVVYDQLYDSLNVTSSLSTETCKILEGFEHLLELKALQRVFLQREQWDAANEYKREYEDLLEEYIKACKLQNTISPLVPYSRSRNGQFIFTGTLSST